MGARRRTGAAQQQLRAFSRTEATPIPAALTALADTPHREAAENPIGPCGLHRPRVGSHRVAHQVEDGELIILVVEIGDRREIFRGI
ncbi:type II toxin-antitoxin system RelE/ParE family toxin [Streptomyces sp. NPDC006879]|uniref:type II toxin-antitoxin system RelE family toxin n=1 Tax=Streptomyces sp. NPDC006879 TaxID=3364767 RepID=UPI0036813BB5